MLRKGIGCLGTGEVLLWLPCLYKGCGSRAGEQPEQHPNVYRWQQILSFRWGDSSRPEGGGGSKLSVHSWQRNFSTELFLPGWWVGVCFEMNCGLKEGHEADLAPHQECSLRAVDFSRARENHFCVPGKAHSQPLLFCSGLSSALPHWCPQCQGLMDVCKPMMPPSHISSSSLLCCHPSAWILPTRQEEKQRDKRDVIPQSTAQNQSGDRRRAQGDGCSPEKPGTLQERATQINHCKRDTELEFNCCAVPCPLAKSRFTPKGLTLLCSAKSNNDNCCFLWNMK